MNDAAAVRSAVACSLFDFFPAGTRHRHPSSAGSLQHGNRRATTAAACNGLIRRHKASGMSLNSVPVLPEKCSRGYQIRVGPKVMLPTKAFGPSYDSALPITLLISVFGERDTATLHIFSSSVRRTVLRCVTIALWLPRTVACVHTTDATHAGGGVVKDQIGAPFAYILVGQGPDLFWQRRSPADDAPSFGLMAAIFSATRRSPARSLGSTCSLCVSSNLSTAGHEDVF